EKLAFANARVIVGSLEKLIRHIPQLPTASVKDVIGMSRLPGKLPPETITISPTSNPFFFKESDDRSSKKFPNEFLSVIVASTETASLGVGSSFDELHANSNDRHNA
ncbi:MAG: hypothetical protein MR724_12240, partial [Prevotella sp.]|nr:hypothetical protein [Prevotella sp.]